MVRTLCFHYLGARLKKKVKVTLMKSASPPTKFFFNIYLFGCAGSFIFFTLFLIGG